MGISIGGALRIGPLGLGGGTGVPVSATYDPSTATLSGRAPAGSVVTITVDGVEEGTATANSGGDWSYVFSPPLDPTREVIATVPFASSSTVPYPAAPGDAPFLSLTPAPLKLGDALIYLGGA